jgi:hypothetical protein
MIFVDGYGSRKFSAQTTLPLVGHRASTDEGINLLGTERLEAKQEAGAETCPLTLSRRSQW